MIINKIFNLLNQGECNIEVIRKTQDTFDSNGNLILPRILIDEEVKEYGICEDSGCLTISSQNSLTIIHDKKISSDSIEIYDNAIKIKDCKDMRTVIIERIIKNIAVIDELRPVRFSEKGYYSLNWKVGHFHKWTTIKSSDYCGEFALIEDLNGLVHQINSEDYNIKFLDKDGK